MGTSPFPRATTQQRQENPLAPCAINQHHARILTGDAALLGAAVVRAKGRAGVLHRDVAVGAGVVRAERLAAQVVVAVAVTLGLGGIPNLREAVGASVVGAESLAALVHAAFTGALHLPGIGDGGEAVRAADGVAVQRLRTGESTRAREQACVNKIRLNIYCQFGRL